MSTEVQLHGEHARRAALELMTAPTDIKNEALKRMAADILAKSKRVLAANEEDVAAARLLGISESMIDRLTLTPERIEGIAQGLLEVAALPDPVGIQLSETVRPNGLNIKKVSVPLGVIAIIYEARPNVTVDAAGLCLKSGNAVILRGGREAIKTNIVFESIMREAVYSAGLPADCINLVKDTTRASATELMGLKGYIDVLIPRGGASLIKSVVENAKVPVIETGVGNCHVYIDDAADIDMGAKIIFNAKCSRPSVCNAAETLLVSRRVAEQFLPEAKKLLDTKGTRIHGCPETQRILGADVIPATEDDWYREYGDYDLAVKVVKNIHEAISHINNYGSGHSEAIVTDSEKAAEFFLESVDAAAVYHNASTRFTDGGEFGLGAEIGISTQKLHARGPMGLRELTSWKYIVRGNGQVR